MASVSKSAMSPIPIGLDMVELRRRVGFVVYTFDLRPKDVGMQDVCGGFLGKPRTYGLIVMYCVPGNKIDEFTVLPIYFYFMSFVFVYV